MLQCFELPLSGNCKMTFESWKALNRELKKLEIDGVDGSWLPTKKDPSFPNEMLIGSHIFSLWDWYDYWRNNRKELISKFGSRRKANEFYGGDLSRFVMHYLFSLYDGIQSGAKYVSMNVCNVTFEEVHTYEWQHDDYAVMDAALEIINEILNKAEPTFDFLVQNSWWPGFTFTNPKKTEYLLSRIKYPRVGIMLNTGNLMNTNLSLRTQEDGLEYICAMLNAHGELKQSIKGIRLSQSLSGDYVRHLTHVTKITQSMSVLPDFDTRESLMYDNARPIDQKLPWTIPGVVRIIEKVEPEYLSHALYYNPSLVPLKRQIATIKRGQNVRE